MSTGFYWENDPVDAFVALYDAYMRAVHNAVYQVMTQRAPEIENWMKNNASWMDRTGNARQTLTANVKQTVEALGLEVIMILSHGMDYGFWLETKNAGRYSIINPAMDYWVPILLADIQALIR